MPSRQKKTFTWWQVSTSVCKHILAVILSQVAEVLRKRIKHVHAHTCACTRNYGWQPRLITEMLIICCTLSPSPSYSFKVNTSHSINIPLRCLHGQRRELFVHSTCHSFESILSRINNTESWFKWQPRQSWFKTDIPICFITCATVKWIWICLNMQAIGIWLIFAWLRAEK